MAWPFWIVVLSNRPFYGILEIIENVMGCILKDYVIFMSLMVGKNVRDDDYENIDV